MTNDQLLHVLVWLGLGLWLGAFALALARRYRAAAVLNGALAIPFISRCVFLLVRWAADPTAFEQQYHLATPGELSLIAVFAGVFLLVLLGSKVAYRGRLRWGILAWLVNGAGLALAFYMAYFFWIF